MITLLFRLVVLTTADELTHAIARAVCRPIVTARSRVQFQASRYGICGGQSTVETRFPLSVSFHRFSMRIHLSLRQYNWQLTVPINNTVQEPSPAVTPVTQSACSSK